MVVATLVIQALPVLGTIAAIGARLPIGESWLARAGEVSAPLAARLVPALSSAPELPGISGPLIAAVMPGLIFASLACALALAFYGATLAALPRDRRLVWETVAS